MVLPGGMVRSETVPASRVRLLSEPDYPEPEAILAACAIVVLTMTAMFLGWTSNTRDLIAGVQGRYFIPGIPLVMIALSVPQIKIPDKLMRYLVIFAGTPT